MKWVLCKNCSNYALFQIQENFFCFQHSKPLSDFKSQEKLERIKFQVDSKAKDLIINWLKNAIRSLEKLQSLNENLIEDEYNREDKFIIEKCINKLRILLEKYSKIEFVEAKTFYLPLEFFLIRASDDAYRFTENIIMPDLSEDLNHQADMWLKFYDYLFNCNYFKILNSEVTWTYYQLSFQRLNDLLWVGLHQATEYLLVYEYELAEECMISCKEIIKEVSPHQIDEYIIEAFLLVIKHDQANKGRHFCKELQEIEEKIISANKMMKLKSFYYIFMYIFLYLNDLKSSFKYARKLVKNFHSIEANFVLANIYLLRLRLRKSKKYLKNAYILVRKYMKKNFLVRAKIFKELGIISIYQNRNEKAAKYFNVAIKFLKEINTNNQDVAFQKKYYFAKILSLQSNFEQSINIYRELFQFSKKPNTLISSEFINYYQEYVLLLYCVKLLSEARSEILKNIKIWIDNVLPWNHPALFWMYLVISIVSFNCGLWDECKTYLYYAKNIINSKRYKNIELFHAIIDEYLGFLYIKMNSLDKAEHLLRNCLRRYKAEPCETLGYYPIEDIFWITYSLSGINFKKQNFIKSFEYLLKAQKLWDSKEYFKNYTICEIPARQSSISSSCAENSVEHLNGLPYIIETLLVKNEEVRSTNFKAFKIIIESEYNFLQKLGDLSEHFVKYYKNVYVGHKIIRLIREKIKWSLYDEIIERSKNENYWDEKELIAMAFCLSDGLAFLHEKYIYHGNLHPKSILLGSNGKWKIGNFLKTKQFWINSITTHKLQEFNNYENIAFNTKNSEDRKNEIPERIEVELLGKIMWMAASLKNYDANAYNSDTTIKEKYSLKFQKFIDLMLVVSNDNLYWPYMRDINLEAKKLIQISAPENYIQSFELQKLNLILNESKFH